MGKVLTDLEKLIIYKGYIGFHIFIRTIQFTQNIRHNVPGIMKSEIFYAVTEELILQTLNSYMMLYGILFVFIDESRLPTEADEVLSKHDTFMVSISV